MSFHDCQLFCRVMISKTVMSVRFLKDLRRRFRRPLKRILTLLFKDRVYVARSGLARGLKVSGDLGFLGKAPSRRNRFLTSLSMAQKTVYDVGSISVTTLFFSRAVGQTGQVIAFQPNPETFAILRRNVEMNGLTNVRLVNIRLGERRQSMPVVFHGADDVWGTAVEGTQAATFPETKATRVEAYSLDEYGRDASLPPPDFLRIDAEGCEHSVLLGMQGILQRSRPDLLVEVHGETHVRLENLRKIVELFLAYEYDVREMHSGRQIADVGQIRSPRHLFCKPKARVVQTADPMAIALPGKGRLGMSENPPERAGD